MEILQYGFMQRALMAGILISITCGVIGTYVVVRRMVFISGGISHSAFGGIGLGYLVGIDPVLGAMLFAIGSALGIGAISRRTRLPEDTAIGILWAVGMALGIIFIGLSPGFAPDLFGYLFGNILS
ncbi:MAG: metal ABC transporter permease, partial [Dehalococcoidia bacterium]|nr:metal ABC transporter permease [Dehalococcoidia bacterium]